MKAINIHKLPIEFIQLTENQQLELFKRVSKLQDFIAFQRLILLVKARNSRQ